MAGKSLAHCLKQSELQFFPQQNFKNMESGGDETRDGEVEEASTVM